MTALLGRLVAAADAVARAAAWVAAGLLVLILALMVAEIVTRSAFGGSLSFSWEFSAYLLGAVFFLGSGHTLRTGGHVRVGLGLDALPARLRPWLDGAGSLVALGVAAMIATALTALALQSFDRGVRSWFPSQTPLALPQGVLALGLWVLVLQLAARLLRLALGQPAEAAPADGGPGEG